MRRVSWCISIASMVAPPRFTCRRRGASFRRLVVVRWSAIDRDGVRLAFVDSSSSLLETRRSSRTLRRRLKSPEDAEVGIFSPREPNRRSFYLRAALPNRPGTRWLEAAQRASVPSPFDFLGVAYSGTRQFRGAAGRRHSASCSDLYESRKGELLPRRSLPCAEGFESIDDAVHAIYQASRPV